jgi:hypothetical protein
MSEAVLSHGSKRETYSEFVEKFKDKHTTDDCMTPPAVYDAVADWVAETYDLDRSSFVRPFWPGGDYETFAYPEGCVVVDNPPFSLSAKIYKFYNDHNIRFFLFAPALTLVNSSASSPCACIVANVQIEYENGARVPTSFATNLEPDTRARTAPDLHEKLTRTVEQQRETPRRKIPRYAYPPELVTAAMMGQLVKYGIAFGFTKAESEHVSALDAQRAKRKTIFGGGYLLSEKAAAEKAAAEKAAAEKAAAEKAAAIVWTLSERERAIVARLSEGGDACYKTTDTRN